MTNKELIETAKEAMKDLFELNQGRLLEHEQTAYNCLRLFCIRLEKTESILALCEAMRTEAEHNISMYQESDAADWGHQEGVLITNQNAIDIYSKCFA